MADAVTLRKTDGTTVRVPINSITEIKAKGKYKDPHEGKYFEFEICQVCIRETGPIVVEGSATRLKDYIKRLGGPDL